MNEIQLFENEKLGLQVRTILNEDGSILVNAEDTAIGFGWIQEKNERIYVRWETMNSYCNELGFSQQVGKDDYIPESLFYMLGMKANNERALAYQKWIAMDLLPTLRKTGFYEMPKKKEKSEPKISFKEIVEVIPLIAEDLGVNNISKLVMYKGACKDYNVPTNFLPDYIDSGDREKKSATELLKQFQCGINARQFNLLLLTAGYLEERERKSTSSKTGVKKYKVLTKKGKKYGENQTAEQNAKETQPLYYVDTFQELFHLVKENALT